jgi:hypothetical protein
MHDDEARRADAGPEAPPRVNVACWVAGDDDRIDDVRDGTILLSRLWSERVLPELARRGIAAAPEEYVERVQVLHGINGTVTVRLNDETKIAMLFRYEGPPIDRSAFAYAPERVGLVQAVELTDDDPVAAHEVAIRGATGWWVSFDFRYYRKKIADCVRTATEFAYAARAALEADCMRAFAENLFVAAEQLAWAQMLLVARPEIFKSRSHKHIVSRFQQWAKMGNADPLFAKLLDRFAKLRNPARYRSEEFALGESEARQAMQYVDAVIRGMSTWRPSRAMGPLPAPRQTGLAEAVP